MTKLNAGASPRLTAVERIRTWMRRIASYGERAAIARAIADPGVRKPALNPDPAALDTLAEGAPCAASDGESPPGECSHPIEQRLFLTEVRGRGLPEIQVPSRCHATGFPGTAPRIASWEGPSGITAPISWPGRGQDAMGMPANGI